MTMKHLCNMQVRHKYSYYSAYTNVLSQCELGLQTFQISITKQLYPQEATTLHNSAVVPEVKTYIHKFYVLTVVQ